MASNNAKSRRMTLLASYGLLGVGFLAAVVFPHLRAVSSARADIARYTEEIATRQEQQHQLETVNKSIELLKLETSNYDRLVPANEDYGSFVTALSDLLDRAGMRDITLSALQPTPLGKAQRKPIEIRGKGTYKQFSTFLAGLENLNRKSSVGKLSIESDSEINGNITASFTVYIYSTNNDPVKPAN